MTYNPEQERAYETAAHREQVVAQGVEALVRSGRAYGIEQVDVYGQQADRLRAEKEAAQQSAQPQAIEPTGSIDALQQQIQLLATPGSQANFYAPQSVQSPQIIRNDNPYLGQR